MRLTRLLFGAILFFSEIALGTTRWKTDELTNSDNGPMSFPGGIIVPTGPQAPVSDATFFSSATYSATITGSTNTQAVLTPSTLKYDRAGKYVHVWGQILIDPLVVFSTATTFFISLPIPPAPFVDTARAAGTVGIPATATSGSCTARNGGHRTVRCTYGATTVTGDLVNVNFIYSLE